MRFRRLRGLGRPAVGVLLTLTLTLLHVPVAPRAAETTPGATSPDPANPTAVRAAPQRSAAQLFAEVERAWAAGEAGALASYCDSAAARVTLKPGGSPASAPTLGGLGFLIHDQLRFVATKRFRIVRIAVDGRKRTARAWARWEGDWGGDKGARDLEVRLAARARPDGQWLLTEIRATE